jgi:hypothetical protein
MPENPSVTLPGTVEKVIPSIYANEAGTAEISVNTRQDLYRAVRIENTLTNESGDKVSLKVGSPVEVTIAAEAESTTVQSSVPFSQKTRSLWWPDGKTLDPKTRVFRHPL